MSSWSAAAPLVLAPLLFWAGVAEKFLLCDAGRPRNAASHHLNGFLTRDGTDPGSLRALGRSELSKYDTVRIRDDEVVDARRNEDGFTVTLSDLTVVSARKLS